MSFARRTAAATAAATTTTPATVSSTATSSSASVIVIVLTVLSLPIALLGHGLLKLCGLLSTLGEAGDGSRNGVGVLVDVKALINVRGDGQDFSTQIPFDVIEVEAVFPVD